jgi:hypothetical protein
MNNIEMQYEFTKLIQEMDESFEAIKRPTSETIFRMLNYSIDRYIKQKYLSGPSMKQNIQEIQYRADDLRNLIVRDVEILPAGAPGTYTQKVVMTAPANYMFYIRSDSKITRTVSPIITTPEWTPNRVANYDEIDKIVTSPTNKPILRKPVVLFGEFDSIYVHYDGYTYIDTLALTYLRKPKLLVIDINDSDLETDLCELASHTHEDIVRMSVSMYIDEYKAHLTSSK